ncbi:MAG: putative metal-binding motif-containing protein [Flavobacteriales bacterium]|nr:putative metal-binding motif-containing protein [Flavobacteriales bacterium]
MRGCPPLDCNDADALVNPGATELCGNGTDDDCDGTPDNNTDPGAFVLFYIDSDGDGFGDAAISNSACAQPAGYVANDNDCDDTDPNIFPGQNCSAVCSAAESAWVNANFADYRDALMNAFSNCLFENDPALCIQNELEGAGFPLSAECNACGVTWATCVRANCLIACVQGQAACEACMNTAGCNAGLMLCFGLTDADADGWPAGSDCSDTNAAIHPQAPELCDGVDNDCDGQIDEGNVCCPDNDADGFTTCAGDCDDSDSQVSPDATEVCDGIDNNCDGQVDEGGVCVCAPAGTPCDDGNACTVNDTEDGACNCISGTNAPVGTVCDDGDPNTSNDVCNGTGICIGTPCTDNDADGFTTCQGDCNDNNLNINPARPELCNGVDDDCDGQVDEGCAPETCNGIDDDGDGLTDAADPSLVLVPCENQIGVCSGTQKTANLCVGGIWLTCAASDYAIGSPVYETTETTCDTQDNDCDGQVDEDNVCDPCSGPNVCNISGQCFTSGQANPVAYCQVCNPLQSTTSWSFRPFGTVCIQGTDCTFSSVCDGLGQCGPLLNRPAGTACDDGNPNTSNDMCNGTGICIGTPCTDNDASPITNTCHPGLWKSAMAWTTTATVPWTMGCPGALPLALHPVPGGLGQAQALAVPCGADRRFGPWGAGGPQPSRLQVSNAASDVWRFGDNSGRWRHTLLVRGPPRLVPPRHGRWSTA